MYSMLVVALTRWTWHDSTVPVYDTSMASAPLALKQHNTSVSSVIVGRPVCVSAYLFRIVLTWIHCHCAESGNRSAFPHKTRLNGRSCIQKLMLLSLSDAHAGVSHIRVVLLPLTWLIVIIHVRCNSMALNYRLNWSDSRETGRRLVE